MNRTVRLMPEQSYNYARNVPDSTPLVPKNLYSAKALILSNSYGESTKESGHVCGFTDSSQGSKIYPDCFLVEL